MTNLLNAFNLSVDKKMKQVQIGSYIGSVAGMYYAYKHNKSFLMLMLFSLGGAVIGSLAVSTYQNQFATKSNDNATPATTTASLETQLNGGKPPINTHVDDGSSVDEAMKNFL